MEYLIKPQQYSTSMIKATISSDAWIRLLKNPPIVPDKTQAPLAIYGRMMPNIEYDVKRNAHCVACNIDSIYALQVDIDNGLPIDDFATRYGEYKWTLYTSYSYGYKFDEAGLKMDRYRVIFPLVSPVKMASFSPYLKAAMVDVFPDSDPTCFDKAHWQILPCIRSAESPYRYIQHDGKRFDLLTQSIADYHYDKWIADDQARKAEAAKKRAERNDEARESRRKDAALRKAQEIINDAQQGSRNRTLWSVLNWLHSTCDMDVDECEDLDVAPDMENEYQSMLRRIWSS